MDAASKTNGLSGNSVLTSYRRNLYLYNSNGWLCTMTSRTWLFLWPAFKFIILCLYSCVVIISSLAPFVYCILILLHVVSWLFSPALHTKSTSCTIFLLLSLHPPLREWITVFPVTAFSFAIFGAVVFPAALDKPPFTQKPFKALLKSSQIWLKYWAFCSVVSFTVCIVLHMLHRNL